MLLPPGNCFPNCTKNAKTELASTDLTTTADKSFHAIQNKNVHIPEMQQIFLPYFKYLEDLRDLGILGDLGRYSLNP